MIDLWYWPTPNGKKVSIMLEECAAEYTMRPVNILKGEQFDEAFLRISPNNKMPVIVDLDADDLTIFESGAILQYLAEKFVKFMPGDIRGKYEVLQWLNFQTASVGPMFGQCGHFLGYAPEKIPYAIERYQKETHRLYSVMDKRLGEKAFLAGDYSIADMAVFPWIEVRWLHEIDIDLYPNVKRWYQEVERRPAVAAGMALLKEHEIIGNPSDETREVFFGATQQAQGKD